MFVLVVGVKSINSGLIIYSPYVKLVPLHSSVLPKSYAKVRKTSLPGI